MKLNSWHMNKVVIIIWMLLCTSAATLAQSTEQKAIAQTLEHQRLAWNQGNLEKYMASYWNSDSLVFIGKRGPQYGWQKTLDNYKKSYPDKAAMGELQFNLLKIEIIGHKDAFVMGQWILKRANDEPQGYFTLRLKKINNEWKIVYDHSS